MTLALFINVLIIIIIIITILTALAVLSNYGGYQQYSTPLCNYGLRLSTILTSTDYYGGVIYLPTVIVQ